MKLMTLLVKNFKLSDGLYIKLKHEHIEAGEVSGANIHVILDYLHENFSRREVRKILMEGSFEVFK
jgi:uncharacterized PurR-regulated membrane protein YhhQ (DUF165 family)